MGVGGSVQVGWQGFRFQHGFSRQRSRGAGLGTRAPPDNFIANALRGLRPFCSGAEEQGSRLAPEKG